MAYLKKKYPELKFDLFCFGLEEFDSKDDYVSGRCNYHDAIIMLNEPDAKLALRTILHEGGHYIHFKKSKLSPDDYLKLPDREFYADKEAEKLKVILEI